MTTEPSSGAVRAVAPLFVLSIAGIMASALFQIMVIRALGPASFGILAAYLALINVAAIGSSAVRNSVAVGVARVDLHRAGARDRTQLEALTYGGVFAVVVVVLLLGGAYPSAVGGIFVLAAVIPYFVFARAQGLMQGAGRVARVLVWSTAAQLAQLLLAWLVLSAQLGWLGVLASTGLVAVATGVGASFDARRLSLVSAARPFAPITVRALVITLAFSWLISMDVSWVRLWSDDTTAGQYSAATTIVKMAFLVPTTLALYLLPRFAHNVDNRRFQVRAVAWSMAAAGLGAIGLTGVLALWPDLLELVLGEKYAGLGALTLAMSLAFLPWILSQTLVTQLTTRGSRLMMWQLVCAVAIQPALAWLVLPDLSAWILAQGALGLCLLVGGLGAFRRILRAGEATQAPPAR
ncbi:MAG TPA: hypothetical protein VK139_06055 [Microbacteriaceae bacterium]|nr:hypothetical protein [Microbacteriaceae bacterium]